MIEQILLNNNERCYSNFSPIFREANTPKWGGDKSLHGKGRHVVGQQQDLTFVYRLGYGNCTRSVA
jgi:hypothetical protein